MNDHDTEARRCDGPAMALEQPGGWDAAQVRRLFLASRRGELLAPMHAIVEVSGRLLSDAAGLDAPQFVSDIDRIHVAGHKLLELVEDVLDPDLLSQPVSEPEFEVIRSRIRHEFLNKLNPIINYSEMWLEDEDHFVEGFLSDLQLIYDSAKRCFGFIDMVLKFSHDPADGVDGPVADLIVAVADKLLRPGRHAGQRLSGHVLVADDNETNRDILRRHLESQGHTVAVAADGREALQLIRDEPLDLVLLDIIMPHVNGFEVLAALKNDPQWRDLPVIIISALEEMDVVARCIELGADDYLPKPFNSTVLRARIGACLEKRRLRRQEAAYLARIQAERQRSEELLQVILPADIIVELKRAGQVTPRRYERIAVLFADIVGFTRYCEGQPPEHVVRSLQKLVVQWEEIALRNGVYKIKTIGDAFMAACGLFETVENPVLSCIRCGVEMIESMRGLPLGWNLRVGVHYGSVVGGVVGHRQYLFDLWGDTVNTASRMESHGVEGAIALSAEAWRQVEPHCRGTPMGQVDVKGKGLMEMFRIDPAGGPVAFDADRWRAESG